MSVFKSVPQVYRDCLRLIDHIAGRSRKADVMRCAVRAQFRMHAAESDPAKIDSLKLNAMSGLANYLTMESLSKLESQGGTPVPRRTLSAPAGSASGAAANFHVSKAELEGANADVAHLAAAAAAPSAALAGVLDAEVSAMPGLPFPPASPEVLRLQALIRSNKAARLELERKAREGEGLP